MQLSHNDLSVDQYEDRFSELSRFAPRLVKNQEDKAKRFLNGLKTDFRRQLVPLNLKNYNEIYERAQLIEQELMKEEIGAMVRPQHHVSQGNNRRDKRPNQFGRQPFGFNKKHDFRNQGGDGSSQGVGRAPYLSIPCHRCGKHHDNSPCTFRRGCYGCGQQGHILRNCPRMRQQPLSAMSIRQPQPPTSGGAAPQGNQQRPLAQG